MRWLSDRTVEHLKRVAEWPDLAETKYRLLEELGRGGMGTVFLAEDRVLGRRVALKVVGTAASDPGAAARMLREARVIARLEHPGIVPVHDAGTLPDGRMFYAMKRVDGRRLDEIAAGAPLPERLRIFQKVCEAVAFAHAHGVLHRDLKPENVMVGRFGEVLVMDWGVAQGLEDASEAVRHRAACGTTRIDRRGHRRRHPRVHGSGTGGRTRRAVGPAADIYALGGLLYTLLTGRPPFDGEAARRRARGEVSLEPRRPGRPAPSRRPSRRSAPAPWRVEPGARYASAEELAAEVARYLDGARVLAHREGPGEKAARVFARYRTPILLIAAYLLVRSLLLLYLRSR